MPDSPDRKFAGLALAGDGGGGHSDGLGHDVDRDVPSSSQSTRGRMDMDDDIEAAYVSVIETDTARPRTPLLGRAKRTVKTVPGVAPVLRVVDAILGPSNPTVPPLPGPLEDSLVGRTLQRLKIPVSNLTKLGTSCAVLTKRAGLRRLWFPYLLLWIMGFILLVRAAYYPPNGAEIIGCTATFWPDWPPDYCGQDGSLCAPGLEEQVVRCPGGCRDTPLGNARWVGGQEVNGVPLLIGGGDANRTFRADSWVCAAGIHAGQLSPTYGGCLRLKPLPFPSGFTDYIGTKSSGLKSLSFGPNFPAAFTLTHAGSGGSCIDYHWPITAYNVILLFLFTLFFAPPPGVLFSTLLILGYAQIKLASDPPNRPPDWSDVFGGVPPMLLAGYWAWNVSFRRTLQGFAHVGLPLAVAVWQGFGFWVGVESSTLFAKIPISRLGYGKLSADGIVALVIIIILVGAAVLIQAWEFRRLGYLRYYLARYLPLVPILIILACIGHGYYLRLHHYLLAMAGIPVMSLPNRISLFGQAFLLAFFLDGVARWGWASILQGEGELIGDAVVGSALPLVSAVAGAATGNLTWPAINGTYAAAGITSFALLLDDLVVAANTTATNFSLADVKVDLSIDHYFRIAYMANGTSMDFTDPATWTAANQSWAVPPAQQ